MTDNSSIIVFCPTSTSVDESGVHIIMYPQDLQSHQTCLAILAKCAEMNAGQVRYLANGHTIYTTTPGGTVSINTAVDWDTNTGTNEESNA